MLTPADITKSRERIGHKIRRTPVVPLDTGGFSGVLKLENLQHTGSFKPRGIFNRVLAAQEAGEISPAGVLIASGGNAGLALAHTARVLGVPAEVFVPESVSAFKVGKLRAEGARVTLAGAFYPDALAASEKQAALTGATVVHAYDHRDVAAGHGTLALELLEQAPDITTVLVAVGGGGLVAGVLGAVGDRVKVVAVESRLCPTLNRALAAGGPVDVDVSGIAADALGARRVGGLAYELAVAHGVESVLVEDDAIAEARGHLWSAYRTAAEHGGAVALAALRSGAYRPAPSEKVAVVICGGNTDPSDLGR